MYSFGHCTGLNGKEYRLQGLNLRLKSPKWKKNGYDYCPNIP